MNILGFGGSLHDFSACLVRNGEIRYAIEEERLSRQKHVIHRDKFKGRGADYCLQAAGIGQADIDLAVCTDIMNFYYGAAYGDRLHMMNHHLSHAASAFYPSPFEEAAIYVADGRGSYLDREGSCIRETSSGYIGRGSHVETLFKRSGEETADYEYVAHSIGVFYHIVTQCIGFGFMQDGKTMGLAPFGSNAYVRELSSYYSLDEEGQFVQTIAQMKAMEAFIRHTLERAGVVGGLEQARADFAYAVQHHTEEILIAACRYLHKKTGMRNLCLAGGVFLNSVANRRILEETAFEQLFVQPAAGDAGTAIGCALYGWHVLQGRERIPSVDPFSPYLGREYHREDYEAAVRSYQEHIEVRQPDDLFGEAAELLRTGHVIGWFQGRSEIGPRALGNRSILADPRRSSMKDQINSRIKHRESFRPFAPVVMDHYRSDYFVLDRPSPYMLLVPDVRKQRYEEIPAVTHVDGTGRVQTVEPSFNPHLHKLLASFHKLTGTPVLLNTSFNDNEEPIVESPTDAIESFLRLDLDCLVIGDLIVTKKNIRGD